MILDHVTRTLRRLGCGICNSSSNETRRNNCSSSKLSLSSSLFTEDSWQWTPIELNVFIKLLHLTDSHRFIPFVTWLWKVDYAEIQTILYGRHDGLYLELAELDCDVWLQRTLGIPQTQPFRSSSHRNFRRTFAQGENIFFPISHEESQRSNRYIIALKGVQVLKVYPEPCNACDEKEHTKGELQLF